MTFDPPSPPLDPQRRLSLRERFKGKFAVLVLLALMALIFTATLWNAFFRNRKPPEDPAASAPRSERVGLVTPPPPEQGYVGGQVCAKCHLEIAKTYAEHPMGRSLSSVADPKPVEAFDERAQFEARGKTYKVEIVGSKMIHHEIERDEQGRTMYDQAVEISHAIGSGEGGRSYLIERDGLFFQSPISWYSAKAKWDLSPGYEHRPDLRFERRVGEQCLACHAGRVNTKPGSTDRFASPPFAEAAIGCERCHGPGEKHVALREANPAADASQDPIVNPSRLEPRSRESVCNQCHLHGEPSVARYGRTFYDFRPGQPLEDAWTAFTLDEGPRDDGSTRSVSHVVQMRASACFTKSAGKMGCVSCHDPHESPSPERKADFYRERCLNCHADKGCSLAEEKRQAAPAFDSCVHCHMPKSSSSDIAHTALTDHRVPRVRGGRQPAREFSRETPILAFFDRCDKRIESIDVARARGLASMTLAAERRDADLLAEGERLLERVHSIAPNDVDVLEQLGVAAHFQRRVGAARDYWLEALKVAPEREGVLLELATLEELEGNRPAAIEYLRRLLAINPWIAANHAKLAKLLSDQGNAADSEVESRKAQELDPTRSPAS